MSECKALTEHPSMSRRILLDRRNRARLPTSFMRLSSIIGLFFTMSGLLVASGRANPVTVFSTFGPDNLYVSESGDLVENVPSAFQALAAAFIPDQSGALEGVDLGMSEALAGPASVSLFADKNDSPDSANESLLGSVTPTKPLEPDNNSVLSLTYGGSPLDVASRNPVLDWRESSLYPDDRLLEFCHSRTHRYSSNKHRRT